MAFTPVHEMTIQYGLFEDGEWGMSYHDNDVPLVVAYGMVEAAKTWLTDSCVPDEGYGD